jgi:hypothetical protein
MRVACSKIADDTGFKDRVTKHAQTDLKSLDGQLSSHRAAGRALRMLPTDGPWYLWCVEEALGATLFGTKVLLQNEAGCSFETNCVAVILAGFPEDPDE